MPVRAGIRELRQNLSRYVDRVKAGDTIEVTEHGRLVAALVPREDLASELADLDRRGLTVTAARIGLDSLAPTPSRRRGQRAPSELLEELRRSERY
jgi:prevent-host-death family protein